MAEPRHRQRPSTPPRAISGTAWLVWLLLLVAPTWALLRVSGPVDKRLIAGLAAGCSLLTFFIYRYDKRQAEASGWRVPEATLQGLSLLGGWPGAFLAQHGLRHKTAKLSFQVTFWAIVLLHQCAAIDALRGWPWTRAAWRALGL